MWYFSNDKFHLNVLYVTTQKICLWFIVTSMHIFYKNLTFKTSGIMSRGTCGNGSTFLLLTVISKSSHAHTVSLTHKQDKSTQILTDIDFYLRTHYQWSWIWSKSPASLVMLNHYRLVFGSKQPYLPITRTIKWTLFLSFTLTFNCGAAGSCREDTQSSSVSLIQIKNKS